MILLIIIILSYLFIRVVVVLYNYAAQPYLLRLVPEDNPLVSILIPARNEAENIARLLPLIIDQSYPNLEILVYDDLSEDQTANSVLHFASLDQRLSLLEGKELPKGWLGKNHACHNLALKAKGDFLLFLDADVEPSRHLVTNAVGYMQQHHLNLLSIFPGQIKQSIGEELTIPLMYDILLSLLPIPLVGLSKRHTFSGANGQFMLFKRDTYLEQKPHWWKKNESVEDMAIMTYFKKLNLQCETLLGGDDIACRMYKSGREAIRGFSKNVISFFGNSILFSIFHLAATSFGLLLVLYFNQASILSIYLIALLVLKAITGRMSNESVLKSWLLIFPRHMATAYVICRALLLHRSRNYVWKGRSLKIVP